MKKADVQIGGTYLVKVASNLVPVTITREHDSGGWEGKSVKTGKAIRIKSAQRLRRRLADAEHLKAVHKADQENARLAEERANASDGQAASERAMAESASDAVEKPLSLLDAAAEVLAQANGEPMRCKEIVERAVERGLWTPRSGKTPANTLHAAINREINAKGDAGGSRFVKADRGKFARAGKGA